MDGPFGDLLRRHRLRAALTQEALAERAGISVQAVGSLERGDRQFPHRQTIERLAEALVLASADRARFAAAAKRRPTPRRPETAPRQLPADVARFIGRDEHVKAVYEHLDETATVAVSAITGMAGVGKTSLAIHVAHGIAERFPDGQLYVDLRGTGEPLSGPHAVALLLRALGVASDTIPGELAEAAALLRSCLAERRVLLVLDNAADTEQVTPLLPGSGASAAIVTSRRLLALPQARHLPLNVLTEPDAIALLASAVGAAQVAAEPEAAAAVVRHCGHLPLALHLVGGRLAARPDWPLSHSALRLADERSRLGELDRDDIGVRASFAISIDHLDKSDAWAFALLGVIDGPVVSVSVAARLFDLSEHAAELTLERLADRHLVQAMTPGRYRIHDLLHAYARERAEDAIAQDDRTAAQSRVIELLAAMAWRGLVATAPDGVRATWAARDWAAEAPGLGGSAESFGWLDEHRHLLEPAATAPGVAPELVVRLGIGLFVYFLGRGHSPDWVGIASATLAAAQSTSDRMAQAIARMDVGIALANDAAARSGDFGEAVDQLNRSIAEFTELGVPPALAMCVMNTGDVLETAGDVEGAIALGERALAICEGSPGFPGGKAVACANLGGLYGKTGDHAKELDYYQRSLSLLEDVGYTIGVVDVLRRIGMANRAAGRHDLALATLRRSVALCREHGFPVEEAGAHHQLGSVLDTLGEQDEARAHWRAALAGYEQYGAAAPAEDVRALLAANDRTR